MTSERQKILITGASGFIFSNFVRNSLYEKRQFSIVTVDKMSSSLALKNIFVNKHSNNYIADITDEHVFSRIVECEKPDIIIHAAAMTSVDEAISSPNEYVHNNVVGTQIVAKVASKLKVPKFIYISTDEVYGHLTSENDASWLETAPIAPRNTYSATKAAGEHLVVAIGNAEGLNYNIIRMANNYGPRQTVNKFIPRAVQSLLNNEKIKIYGEGRQMRDWLHVRDSYTGIQTIIEKGESGETYNIGAGQEFSNIEVAQLICKNMQKGLEVEFVADRPGHDFRYSLSSEKLRKLGWEPKIKFKDGITNTIEWFLLNRYWIKKENK